MSVDPLHEALVRTLDRGLSGAELAVLRLACAGHDRAAIAQIRGVKPSTIKKQIQVLLYKLNARSLPLAVNVVLRDALAIAIRVDEGSSVE